MTERIRNIGPKVKRINIIGPKARRIDPEEVRKALGAERMTELPEWLRRAAANPILDRPSQ